MIPRLRHVLLLGFCIPLSVSALSKDQEEPIHVEADSVHIDENTGVSTYAGNVKYTQGTISLLADTATLKKGEIGIEQFTALGKPAVYTELPDGEEVPVTAKGYTIAYDAAKETITLTEQAEVVQKNDYFKAPIITYFRNSKVVESTGGRSYILIHPENHPKKKN